MNYKIIKRINIMKKIITICIACIITLSCKAQQVIDMAANNNMDSKYENGTYYHKDVNNYLDAFTGTWKYEYDTNKEYRINLTKVEMYHELDQTFNFNYYTDGFSISYQMYENNVLVYQSPTIDFAGGSIKNSQEASLAFRDFGRLGAPFNLDLTLTSEIGSNGGQETMLNFNLIKWHAENPYHDEHPDEPYFSIPNDILMTKVE
jgi:hypothetical protein